MDELVQTGRYPAGLNGPRVGAGVRRFSASGIS